MALLVACGEASTSGADDNVVSGSTSGPPSTSPRQAEPGPVDIPVVSTNPSQIVTLHIISVKVDSSVGEVRIEYEIQSSRAKSATIALESRAGMVGGMRNFDDEGKLLDTLTLEQGRARGTAVVDLEQGADLVRGALVATTRFNSPAAEFWVSGWEGHKVNWPVLVVLAGLVIGFAVYRARQSERRALSKGALKRSPDRVERVLFYLGAGAIVFPVVYAVFFVERRSGFAILFAAHASALQLVVWAPLLWLMRTRGSRFAAAMFGIGAWIALGSTLLVAERAPNIGLVAAWYLGVAVTATLASGARRTRLVAGKEER